MGRETLIGCGATKAAALHPATPTENVRGIGSDPAAGAGGPEIAWADPIKPAGGEAEKVFWGPPPCPFFPARAERAGSFDFHPGLERRARNGPVQIHAGRNSGTHVLVQHHGGPAGAAPARAAPGHQGAHRTGRFGAAVSHGGHHARGQYRPQGGYPGGDSAVLPPMAAHAPVPGAAAGAGGSIPPPTFTTSTRARAPWGATS